MLETNKIQNVIAVASGKGGVGKSTLSINLALSLKQLNYSVGILDADVYGPSLPQLADTQGLEPIQVYQNQPIAPITQYDIPTMSMGYIMKKEDPAVWRGPIISAWVQKLFSATDWGSLNYLIVDLPPGTGDIPLTVAQKIPLKGVVFITTPQKLALSDVHKSIAMFQKIHIPLLGLVENMSYYQCTHCDEIEYLFGKGNGTTSLAEDYDMNVIERLPLNQKMCDQSEHGQAIVIQEPFHPMSQKFQTIGKYIVQKLNQVSKPKSSRIPVI